MTALMLGDINQTVAVVLIAEIVLITKKISFYLKNDKGTRNCLKTNIVQNNLHKLGSAKNSQDFYALCTIELFECNFNES